MYMLHTETEPTLTEVLNADRDASVEKIMENMTLEEKVGQMFMGCFYNGTPLPQEVSQYHLGGVLLFSASFENSSPEEVSRRLEKIGASFDIKPFMAVDEEGGSVNRVSSYKAFRSNPFPSPRECYESGGMKAVIGDTHEKNRLLKSLGINLNLAPVCDISLNEKDFMYSRSLGQPPHITADYAVKTVEACLEDDIGCCLKHFPGYGNTADTHKGLAVDNRSLEQLKQEDFLPFEAGISAGAPAVLVSHNMVPSIDHMLPSSLSPAAHKILRYDMGFKGVIITDDMSMGAVSQFLPQADSAVAAVKAGNDILCTGAFKEQHRAVTEAVKSGEISYDRIDSSVRRILKWKKQLSLF